MLKDLCIHRGAALSLGWAREGRIVCPYHGWEYDRSGACVRIPSLPEDAAILSACDLQFHMTKGAPCRGRDESAAPRG